MPCETTSWTGAERPAHASGRSSCLPSPQFWGRDSCSQQWLKIKRATVIRDPIASRSGSLAKAKNMPLGILGSCLGHYVDDIATSRSEEHTSELQSLMRISYAVFCLKKKTAKKTDQTQKHKTDD